MPNIIADKSLDFALECIEVYQKLQAKKEYILSKQLLRSWTSIWANISEATAAQSKRDFFAKICIAYKEAHETHYWITLLKKSTMTEEDLTQLEEHCLDIIRMLAKIKLTTEKNISESS